MITGGLVYAAVFFGRPGFLGAAPSSMPSVGVRGVRVLRVLGVATYSSESTVSISASAAWRVSSALATFFTRRLRSALRALACWAVSRTFWNSSKLRAMRVQQ